eukprot:326691_1
MAGDVTVLAEIDSAQLSIVIALSWLMASISAWMTWRKDSVPTRNRAIRALSFGFMFFHGLEMLFCIFNCGLGFILVERLAQTCIDVGLLYFLCSTIENTSIIEKK